MHAALDQLGQQAGLDRDEGLRLAFGLACVERVHHLLEEPRAIALLAVLRLAVHAGHHVSEQVVAEAGELARAHRGSASLDGSGHSAVSATHALARALAGRALEAADYAAYAAVYAYGRYAVNDPTSFEPEHAWQLQCLRTLVQQRAAPRAPLHIGIVGCSAEGAALCYRTLCAEGASRLGGHAHPEVSLHTPSLAGYVRCLEAGDIEGVARLMLVSAGKLAAAGADFLVCPDNTIHQAFDLVAPRSPLPWLHIAEVVAQAAARRGARRVGVLGTAWLVRSEVYPGKLAAHGIEAVRPSDADRALVARIILDELVPGVVRPDSTARLVGVIERLRDRGCDAVALACTELPLVLDDGNSPLPTLDSPRLLARAALDRALAPR